MQCEKFRHAEGKRGRPAANAPCQCGQTYSEHDRSPRRAEPETPAAEPVTAPTAEPVEMIEETIEEGSEEPAERTRPVEELGQRPFSPALLARYAELIRENGYEPAELVISGLN